MKTLRYFLINSFFAYSIYAGLYLNQVGFLKIAVFLGWVTSITSLMLYNKDVVDKAKQSLMNPSVPPQIDILFDLSVAGIFVYHGYVWLPIFYLIHVSTVFAVRKELIENN